MIQEYNFSTDLVDKAQNVVDQLELKSYREMALSYAQLRKVLSIIVEIKNKFSVWQAKNMGCKELPDNIAFDIRFMKTNLLYQAGRIDVDVRDKNNRKYKIYPMKSFLSFSELISLIDSIGKDIERFKYLCKYMEAIVAFYKYRSVELSGK